MDAVRHLGYAPNFGARSLASRKTRTIGAIIPTLDNAIFATGLQAFQQELAARGYTLLVASSNYDPEVESDQIQSLIARGADGLLFIGYDRDPEDYEFLKRRNVPYVVCWAHDLSRGQLSIGFDNRGAMRGMANEVLQAGHKKIAVISAHRKGNDRARDRVEGVLDAVRAAGIDTESVPIVETVYAFEAGADAFRDLMMRQPRPTAVICGNDVLAVGALTAAADLGIRVPQEVSVTGFDDIEIAHYVQPKLTTIHVPHRKMGRQAARMLADMLDGDSTKSSRELETRLVKGASLGPPPA